MDVYSEPEDEPDEARVEQSSARAVTPTPEPTSKAISSEEDETNLGSGAASPVTPSPCGSAPAHPLREDNEVESQKDPDADVPSSSSSLCDVTRLIMSQARN